jgi:hypothetical protein
MTDYWQSYSFDLPAEKHSKKRLSFVGPKEYIDKLRAKPVRITANYTVGDWNVQAFGYGDGTLKQIAERQEGLITTKIEQITPNYLAKFINVEIEGDYSPYNPIAETFTYVEVSDKLSKINKEFQEIDNNADQPYQHKFNKSSIYSVDEFLRNEEFEELLKRCSN